MKTTLIENQSKEVIGELILKIPPRDKEWIEFSNKMYAVHRVIHTENGLKLMVIGI